jgi:type IV pilus assembly protein PilB
VIYAGGTSDDINAIAISKGVKTLRMAGLEKVRAGDISLEECLRVTVAD